MKDKVYIDLHMHTFHSDGIESPESLALKARTNGSDVIAVTDHDITSGYAPAKAFGAKWGLEVIPGVEVTTTKYHILGLGIDVNNAGFQDFLCDVREIQKANALAKVEVLAKLGVPVNSELILRKIGGSRMGRWNLAQAICTDSKCREMFLDKRGLSFMDFFRQYLNKSPGSPTYGVNVLEDVSPSEAIKQIHLAGGVAVIAHPFKQVKDMKELDELRSYGLDGLEVQPNYGDKNLLFQEYALANGLLITYGSDFHDSEYIHHTRPLLGRRVFAQGRLEELVREWLKLELVAA